MGSSISIEEKMNDMIFYPPDTPEELFYYLNKSNDRRIILLFEYI